MNIHSIDLIGYYARTCGSSVIYLGTAGSHGNEQLQVTQGKGWEGLTVQVVFHPSKVAVQLPANGLLDVPWEATENPLTAMQGRIVFQGFDQDRLVNSTDLAYTVASHSPALGRDEEPYTPGIVEGVLNQMAADKDAILQTAQQTGQAKEAAAASAVEAAGSAANAQHSAGAANTSAGLAAASASQAAGSAAAAGETLTQVQTAGQEAEQKVKDAETEALDKIAAAAPALPAMSSDAAWQSVTVKSDGTEYNLAALAPIEATIRPTANGNPAVCKNSVAWGLQGLKIYGKSVQNGTPSPNNPVPIISAGEGGSVELDATGPNLLNFNSDNTLTDGNGNFTTFCGYKTCILAVSGMQSVYVSGDFSLLDSNLIRVGKFDGFPNIGTKGVRSNISASGALSVSDCDWIALSFLPVTSISFEQIISSFHVSAGNESIPWESYTNQSITLSTPNGLLGIPVESGGNYIDASGQQWICDIKDYGTGKYVQKCAKVTFNGSNRNVNLSTSYLSNTVRYNISLSRNELAVSSARNSFCNILNFELNYSLDSPHFYVQDEFAWIFMPKSIAPDVESLKALAESNPITFIYPLKTPVESDIPAEELYTYRALTTYSGTTVVSTAEPVAGIEAQYVADSTKYAQKVQLMESRLTALETMQIGI